MKELTGEMVPADVVSLSVLDKAPDLGLLQMLKIIVVSSTQLGAHAPLVASDDNTATASRLLGVDAVLGAKASRLDSITEDSSVLVVTDTTEVDYAIRRKHVLGTTSGVLGSAAGNQLGVEVVEEILVERLVLLLGKNGIVVLELVLLEESLITHGLDICSRS